MNRIFQIKRILRTLPDFIQVMALFKDNEKILKTRCFWIGEVEELSFHNGEEFVLNRFISPVELFDGSFCYPGEANNFIDFEVSYNPKKEKEVLENGKN